MEFMNNKFALINEIKNLAKNDYVSEIATNGPEAIFFKEKGKRKSIPSPFSSEEAYIEAVDGLIEDAGLIKNKYLVEGRYNLPGGKFGRLHIIMPPASSIPLVTLAIKTQTLTSLTSIQATGSFNTEISMFLKAAVGSNLTTCISGGTGAGKALHKHTKIPTPQGFKTVDELQVGDIIFDENGNETKILKKYSPNDPDMYEIEFKSGQKVKTSAGHLWKIINLNKKEHIGHSVKIILDEKKVNNLEKIISNTKKDELISIPELIKLTNINRTFASLVVEGMEKYKGEELVKFTKKELLFLQQHIRALEGIDFDDIEELNWLEFKSLSKLKINSNHVRNIISTKKYITDEIYYNKKIALQNLVDECKIRLEWHKNRKKHLTKKDIRPRKIMTTKEMFDEGVTNEVGRLNFAIDYLSKEVYYEEKELKIDPYTLGAWLGDGISDRAVVCGADVEIHKKILRNYKLKKENKFLNKKGTKYLYDWRYEGLTSDLQHYNLLGNKHIPAIYKTSSRKQRIELIAGLIDTDGTVDKKGMVSFGNTIKSIVEDAREIVMSLGWSAGPINSKIGTYRNEETGEIVKCKKIYSFCFFEDGLTLEVPRKRVRIETRRKKILSQQCRHYITGIRKIDDNPSDYYCFQVDSPNSLFLCTEEFIPTHNTTLLEAMASEFKHTERIGVCEDSPELQLDTPNTVYLNSTVWVPGMKDSDVADLSWVVKQINRMRVDKIIIGETRGKEFFDFITAANSGAEGSMTTIHANDGPSAMKKMATFMYMAVDMSPRIINEMISQAVDIVIQLGKNKNGDHKILSIHEITNAISAGDSPTIALNPLFTYDEQSNTWVKKFATDVLKKKFEAHGYNPNSYAIKEVERREAQRGLPSYFKEGMD